MIEEPMGEKEARRSIEIPEEEPCQKSPPTIADMPFAAPKAFELRSSDLFEIIKEKTNGNRTVYFEELVPLSMTKVVAGKTFYTMLRSAQCVKIMGNNLIKVNKDAFHWEYTEEPHRSRRVEILGKHPEIKKLMKSDGDRNLVLTGLALTVCQISFGLINDWLTYAPLRFLFICVVGTWLTTAVMLHVHEAAHGLIFGPNHVWKNRIYGLVINLSLGLPFYSFFKKHHKSHHKSMGDEFLDCEYPSDLEVALFSDTSLGKYLWILANPVIYTIRTPVLMVQRFKWGWDVEEFINIFTIIAFNGLLFYLDCCQMVNYLFCCSMIASQSNMFGFWGLMSHTEFIKYRETYSYYGILNKIYINFGYHVEHHDFPGIPSKYLPEIHRIAPEYYEENFVLNSFLVAVIKFIFDPKVGVQSRLKRPNKSPDEFILTEKCVNNRFLDDIHRKG
uniref:Sphingolipid delta4-desaturase N-terminal domain-containing protein n=1 Tax=Romanomermis culicivorax TaxID=13658 RepID=A0A915KTR5_ROMCU